jgi:hypothetical protein
VVSNGSGSQTKADCDEYDDLESHQVLYGLLLLIITGRDEDREARHLILAQLKVPEGDLGSNRGRIASDCVRNAAPDIKLNTAGELADETAGHSLEASLPRLVTNKHWVDLSSVGMKARELALEEPPKPGKRFRYNLNSKALVKYTFNGETHHLSEWSRLAGIKSDTIAKRLSRGYSLGKALGFIQEDEPEGS